MKIKFIKLLVLIFLGFSVTAQIDNGTNYIPDSRNSQLKAGSLCDQLFTKDGKTYNVLVKETTLEDVKYKMCRDYGTNATVSGPLISLENSKIQKIIFSDGNIKFYNKSNKVLKKNSVKSIDEPKSKLRKNMLSLSAGISNYDSELSMDFSYLQNYYIGNVRYISSERFLSRPRSTYYQLKYLRNLKSNYFVNFHLGLSCDLFVFSNNMKYDIYNSDGIKEFSDYDYLSNVNRYMINLEIESTFFNSKRVQYFTGFAYGLSLFNTQFRITNGLSLLSKNKVHCFSVKSSSLFRRFSLGSFFSTSTYNFSTNSTVYLDFFVEETNAGYPLGLEVQYGFRF